MESVASKSVAGRHGFSFRIAHKMPGRVRIVHNQVDDGGLRLARRFAHHPSVRAVRCAVTARSLTVIFDRRTSFAQILENLPDEDRLPAPIAVVEPDSRSVLRHLTFVLDLLSGNPLAVATALLGKLPSRPVLIS